MSAAADSLKAAWLILLAQTGYWTLAEINAELKTLRPKLPPVQAYQLAELAKESRINHRVSSLPNGDTYNVDQSCYALRKIKLGEMGLLTNDAS